MKLKIVITGKQGTGKTLIANKIKNIIIKDKILKNILSGVFIKEEVGSISKKLKETYDVIIQTKNN